MCTINNKMIINIKENNNLNKKILHNLIDEIVKEHLNCGVLFFSISIEFMDAEKIKYINKEDKVLIDYINWFKKIIIDEIELLSFVYISTKINDENNKYLNILLGVKSIIGYNENLIWNIRKILNWNSTEFIEINELKDFFKITNYYYLLVNNIQEMQKYHWLFLFDKYSCDNYGKFFDFIEQSNYNIDINAENNLMLYSDTVGIKLTDDFYTIKTIVLFWNYYIKFNNLILYNNNLYQLLEGTNNTYKIKFNVNYLSDNIEDVFDFFRYKFPSHYLNFDFYNLKLNFLKDKNIYLNNFNDYIFIENKIELDFENLEITDDFCKLKKKIIFF